MTTDCIPLQLEFQAKVVGDFEGGRADGDSALLREADLARDLTRRLFGIVLGYEDDRDELRDDGPLALAAGCDDLTRERRVRERGHPPAGSSALNRFEPGVSEEARGAGRAQGRGNGPDASRRARGARGLAAAGDRRQRLVVELPVRVGRQGQVEDVVVVFALAKGAFDARHGGVGGLARLARDLLPRGCLDSEEAKEPSAAFGERRRPDPGKFGR